MTPEQRKSKFASVRSLIENPGWEIVVEAISEIQDKMKSDLATIPFKDLNDVRRIQEELLHYEKLKQLPQILESTYSEVMQSHTSNPYKQIDEEYEELMKNAPK